MAYPISRGRFINFCAFEVRPHEEGTHFGGPWVIDVDPSYVISLFQGWESDVCEIMQVRGQLVDEQHDTLVAYNTLSVLGWFKDMPLGCQRCATLTVLLVRECSDSWGCRRHLFSLCGASDT